VNRIKQVLFVCLGNTARSPAAEYLARDYAKKFSIDLEFDSCGFFNAFSYMQPESRKYLDKKGITHSDFTPKIINHKLLEKQDLILTMESTHSEDIKRNFNNVREIEKKTFTLREFNGENHNLDIIDPYYTSNKAYRDVLKLIDEEVKKVVKKINQINNTALDM
jgi:protein-tyrosine phosphatase